MTDPCNMKFLLKFKNIILDTITIIVIKCQQWELLLTQLIKC